MIHLKAIALARQPSAAAAVYPLSIPAIATLERLEYTAPVTIFAGENGSGKSTLLEAIAAASGAIAAGSAEVERDTSLDTARQLGGLLRLSIL